MAGRWDAWLRDLRAARKGGERWPELQIDRGRAWELVLAVPSDVSGDAFLCNLALGPDGTTLVSPTVVVGAFADGVTPVTFSLTAVQTANPTLIPADDDTDGVEDLALDILRSPGGGTNWVRFMAGQIPVSGKV